MDIERGSLDDISRRANTERPRTGSRPSSRVSLSGVSSPLATRAPQRITTPTLLELLPPEDISQQEHDLEVVEYHSSDSDEDDNSEQNATDTLKQLLCSRDTEENGELSVRSENERETADSRGSRQLPSSQAETEDDEDDAIQDPKLRAAIKKMKKLDKILAQKIKREREVKRQRLQLQKQMQEELERAKPEGREELKEAKDNTMKFLALAPPPHHNEGINIDDISPPITPLFATQPNMGSRDGQSTDRSATSSNLSESNPSSAGASSQSSARSRDSRSSVTKNSAGARGKKKNKAKSAKVDTGLHKNEGPDFIQRNIDLASDAGNVIAMTDDEKKRLEELLGDVEMLKEEDEENTNFNPFQLQIAPGLGFRPDEQEQKAINEIDAKLQALLPREDFESICSTPRHDNFSNSEFSFSRKEYAESLDLMQLGERALRDTKESRDQQTRLKEIENELTNLQLRVESEIEYPRLSDSQLQDLLDLCSRVSSRATEETDAIAMSPRSASQSTSPPAVSTTMATNPPRLPEDTLRRLLEDARKELQITSRLSMVREEDRSDSAFTDSSVENDMIENVNEQDITVESVSTDTIQELLLNPRATSRAMSRCSQNDNTMTTDLSEVTPRDYNLTDNGAFTENSDSDLGSSGLGETVFTPRRKLPSRGAKKSGANGSTERDSLGDPDCDKTPTPGINEGRSRRDELEKEIDDDRDQTLVENEDEEEEEGEGAETPRNDEAEDEPPIVEDLEEDSVARRMASVLESDRWRDMTPLEDDDGEEYPEEDIESDLDDDQDDEFGLNDDESLESELRALNMGTPSTDSRASSHLRTESGMSIKELRISKSAFDSRPSSKAHSHGTPVTPEPVPKPPSKASSLKTSARSFQSTKKGKVAVSRSDPRATASRAASETSTLRSDSANTLVESSDFDYENDAEIREQLLAEEEEEERARRSRESWKRNRELASVRSSASSSFTTNQTPHPPSTGRRNGSSRKVSLNSAHTEEKSFSPPLF